MVFEIFYKIKSWEGKELLMNFNLYIYIYSLQYIIRIHMKALVLSKIK